MKSRSEMGAPIATLLYVRPGGVPAPHDGTNKPSSRKLRYDTQKENEYAASKDQ
jgi:hypothetical protein